MAVANPELTINLLWINATNRAIQEIALGAIPG